MNRREFWMTAGGATALSVLGSASLFARPAGTTPLYVRGLAMFSFGDPEYLRIALPKAPHHAATLGVVREGAEPLTASLEGHGRLDGIAPGGPKLDVQLPELVHIRELYADAVPKLEDSPSVISIPWSAVGGVCTYAVSDDRWTFYWKDSNQEVVSFRPRKIAEAIQIDLASTGTLVLNGGKTEVPLGSAKELTIDFVPTRPDMGAFTEHFAFYMPYVGTSSTALVEPRKVGRQTTRSVRVPALGNSFARVWPRGLCFMLQLD